MVLRYRNYQYLLNAVTLGTSLTALFLLVRCSVPERNYADLNIGSGAGSGGASGSGGDGAGGSQAGSGGSGGELGGAGGQGGQAGAPPIEPIPCDPDVGEVDAGTGDADAGDAGAGDAGSGDAGAGELGPADAGIEDPSCACVDGFVAAIDADGDGVGTRACSLAPGLDCDDGDGSITHNSCGGCSELPAALGDDCLECGAYVCDGPDALACAAKPGPVEDPDCRCVDGEIVARDTDSDGAGTRLCEHRPGPDCNDGDPAFITNACGGCESLPGTIGADCNQCGVWACSGTALACVPKTGSAGVRCVGNTRQTCGGTGFWGNDQACANVCYQGSCEVCTPSTFRCVDLGGGSTQVQVCTTNSSSNIAWGAYDSCLPSETCNAANGTCAGALLLPLDRGFDVVPRERRRLPWHELLDTARDADYG